MRNMLLIAKREYLEQIRGRAFKLSTVGLPAIFAAIIGIGYVASLGLGANKHLVIVADDAALANAIRMQLLIDKDGTPNVDVVSPETPGTRADLVREVQSKAIDGFLSIENTAGGVPKATYTAQSSGDFMTNDRMKKALHDGMVNEGLTGAGMKQAQAEGRGEGHRD
jgi:ABC-2 type transport system permease protein